MLTVCIGVLGARFPSIFCFFQLHLWARHGGKVDPHGWGTSRAPGRAARTARTTTVPARFLKRPVLSHTSLKKNNGQWEKWIAFLVLSLTALKLKTGFWSWQKKIKPKCWWKIKDNGYFWVTFKKGNRALSFFAISFRKWHPPLREIHCRNFLKSFVIDWL